MISKVLVIDDEEKLRTLLTRIISLEGFEVLQAGDCKSALKKMSQYEIDIVLSDVKLPDGNGVDLAKTLKEKYPTTE
ncbi:response regulator, partial [Shewanella algae]|uniref:response regulator n=1 Tax=Shewanella algae TaxID=38313 RepID=UPI003184A83D